jgi:hypothetical protein
MCILALAGSVGEAMFCGPAHDGSDQRDLDMAKDYLIRAGCDALQVGAGLQQARDAAEWLLTTDWARQRVRTIADALLQFGSLSGDQISEL